MPNLHLQVGKDVIVHFIGFLANVDSSILSVRLDHGFTIESMSDFKASNIIAALERIPHGDAQWQMLWDTHCMNPQENKCYFIGNSFIVENGEHVHLYESIINFQNKKVNDYLIPVLSLMRLFLKGNICMPLSYFYCTLEGNVHSCGYQSRMSYVAKEPYHIMHKEIHGLQKFIDSNSLAFRFSYIQLAFEQFHLSYSTSNRSLSFQLLMNGLETLLMPKEPDEAGIRVARNAAVLLGSDRDRARNIQSDLEKLMRKKGKLTLSGDPRIVTGLDVLKARVFIRECIKEIFEIGVEKKSLLKLLSSCGYGQRPWKRERKSK